MDTIPSLGDADGLTAVADVIFGHLEDLAEILIGETVFLGFFQSLVGGQGTF